MISTPSKPLHRIRVPRPNWLPSIIVLVILVAVYLGFGVQALDKPGLYMDAVNPDYLVVRMLDPQSPTEYWLAPGNLIAGRFPVLAGPYSGSYVAYLLLPFYWLMGGTLTALRLAHLSFGLAIVIAAFLFLRDTTRSLTVTTAVVAVLAIDPAFTMPFRTQAYLVTFPVLLSICGFSALCRYRTIPGRVAAGACFGLSIFGYFVFGFTLPGIIIFTLIDGPRAERGKNLFVLMCGVALGLLPYVLGYGLIFGALGMGAIDYIHSLLFNLHVDSGQSYLQRFWSVVNWTWLMSTATWDAITFWGNPPAVALQPVKMLVLSVLPLLALPFAAQRSAQARAFRLVGLSTVSFLLTATVFGQRLGGHDLTPFLPLLYLSAGLAVSVLLGVPRLHAAPRVFLSAVVAVSIVLVAINGASAIAITTRLASDSGRGLFSSVFSDYPASVLARNDRTPHIFWQWGSMMQFIYLTDGRVPAYSSGGLRPALCRYGKANLVLTGDESLSHPDIDFAKLGVRVVSVTMLHDAHSGYPYEIVAVAPVGSACETPHAAAAFSLPVGTQLPDGVVVDAKTPFEGVYPGPIGKCCFLAEDAKFVVRVPSGARRLRFDVYPPGFAHVPNERLTFVIDGKVEHKTGVLVKGVATSIDVPIPNEDRGRTTAAVEIRPDTSFVPKEIGFNGDTHRISVILSRVGMPPPQEREPAPPSAYDYTGKVVPTVVPSGLFVDGSAGCCFAGPSAVFRLQVPREARRLEVTLYQPPLPSRLGRYGTMTATFDGRESLTVSPLTPGKIEDVSVPLPLRVRHERLASVVLHFAKTFIPKQEHINGDTRRLSVVIRRLSLSR